MQKKQELETMTNKLAPLGLAVALLSGCSMIPTYERPPAPVPAEYPATASSTASTGAPPAWRSYFAEPRLQQLIEIALNNNRDLRIASLNVEQARAQFQVRRAAQYPSVGLAANASRSPAAGSGDLTNSFSVGLAVTAWELDFFGRVASLKEQALAQYLASEEGRNAAQVSLISAVANGWLTLLADEELLELSRRTLTTREESVRLTKLRLDSGAASELDFRQAESLTQAARATLAQQQRQRALDENALALLLGQPLPAELRASLTRSDLSAAPLLQAVPAGLPSDLLVQRPDIRQAEQQLIAANANIGAARAAFFPRISLTAQAGTASKELSGLFDSGSWGFTLAPSLLLPLFDAGANQANLDSAQVSRKLAVAQYEKAIQGAFREVADALASQSTLAEQLEAQRKQAQAESIRMNLSELRYKNGVASYLDLLDAQRSLFSTQQAVVQVRLGQLQNQVTLFKALGGGWDSEPDQTSAKP
jgi:outer membrane protein, multidrug efflux system